MPRNFGWDAPSGYGAYVTVNDAGTEPEAELHVHGTDENGNDSGDVVIDLTLDGLCDLHGMISLAIEAGEAVSHVAS